MIIRTLIGSGNCIIETVGTLRNKRDKFGASNFRVADYSDKRVSSLRLRAPVGDDDDLRLILLFADVSDESPIGNNIVRPTLVRQNLHIPMEQGPGTVNRKAPVPYIDLGLLDIVTVVDVEDRFSILSPGRAAASRGGNLFFGAGTREWNHKNLIGPLLPRSVGDPVAVG